MFPENTWARTKVLRFVGGIPDYRLFWTNLEYGVL